MIPGENNNKQPANGSKMAIMPQFNLPAFSPLSVLQASMNGKQREGRMGCRLLHSCNKGTVLRMDDKGAMYTVQQTTSCASRDATGRMMMTTKIAMWCQKRLGQKIVTGCL